MAIFAPILFALAAAAQPAAPATAAQPRVMAVASVEIVAAEPITVREPSRADTRRIDRNYRQHGTFPIVDFL